jgi:hypothetical protein
VTEPAADWNVTLDRLLTGDRRAFLELNRLVSACLVRLGAYEHRARWDDLRRHVVLGVAASAGAERVREPAVGAWVARCLAERRDAEGKESRPGGGGARRAGKSGGAGAPPGGRDAPEPRHPAPAALLRLADEPDALSPAERAALERHLARCRPCADELATLASFDFHWLREARRGQNAVAAADGATAPSRARGPLARVAEVVLHPAFAYAIVAALLYSTLAGRVSELREPRRDGPPPGESRVAATPSDGAVAVAARPSPEPTGEGEAAAIATREAVPPAARERVAAVATGPRPTITPTPTPRRTVTPTTTPRRTVTPTPTRTPAATRTPRPTTTPTPRPTATPTPRPTATPTPRPTATATPRPAATATPRPTATRTATPRPTVTTTPRRTATPAPSATAPAAATPTAVAPPGATAETPGGAWTIVRLEPERPVEVSAATLGPGLVLELPVPPSVRAGTVLQVRVRSDERQREILERFALAGGERAAAISLPAAWLVPGVYRVDLEAVGATASPAPLAAHTLVVR